MEIKLDIVPAEILKNRLNDLGKVLHFTQFDIFSSDKKNIIFKSDDQKEDTKYDLAGVTSYIKANTYTNNTVIPVCVSGNVIAFLGPVVY